MTTSVFLARLIGPVMLVIGLAVFANQRAFRDMAEEFLASRALLFLSGLLIMLSEGAGEPNLPVYDTSGPYTDTSVTIDVNAGLSRARIEWVKERGGVEEYQGRDVKPVDNGNVSGDKAAAAFKAHHKPLRGL